MYIDKELYRQAYKQYEAWNQAQFALSVRRQVWPSPGPHRPHPPAPSYILGEGENLLKSLSQYVRGMG